MKPSNDLHQLIHSLSPNEKGYFKKHCQRGDNGSLKYLKLFDAIASQKVYDETKVKLKLKDPVFVRNLSSEKNYLFHLIVEALLYGNTSQDPIHEYELLYAKAKWLATHSFYETASRFCARIRKWCAEHELFTLQLNVLDLELLLWQYLNSEERRSIEEISGDRARIIRDLDLAERLRMLDMKVIRFFQEKGIGRNSDDIAQYKIFYDDSIDIQRKNKELPVRARIYLKNIAVFFHNVNNEAEKSMDDLSDLINMMNTQPLIKKEKLSFYLSSLNNLILLLLHIGDFEEAEKKIALLESTKTETQGQRNTHFITKYNTRFDLYTATCNWEAAYQLSRTLKTELPDFEQKIDNRYTGHIRFAAFRSCYYAGHLKEALQWINTLVQKQKGESFKTEVITIARIAELVIHESLGHYEMLLNLVNSVSRYLEKTNSLYHFEKLMLDFFKEQVNIHPDNKALKRLKEELSTIEKDLMEQRVFTYFDFRAWVEARLSGKEIGAILKKHQ